MSSPQPKVNPPLCDICMSSSDVRQEPAGAWYCMKQRCLRQRRYKPIMVTSIDKDEPVSPGFFRWLACLLTNDPLEYRRPKHPRPAVDPMPQVPRRESPFGGLRSPQNTGSPRPQPPQPAPKLDVGRPPRGGSGALPAPPPIKCPECSSTKVLEDFCDGEDRAFTIEKFICRDCKHKFTYEDVLKAEGISVTVNPKVEHEPLSIPIEYEEISTADEIYSTVREGDKAFVPRPPKTPTSEDRLRPRIEGDSIEMDLRGGLRPNGEGADDALLTATEQKDHAQVPIEGGWIKRETEPAHETSGAWTAIKWIIGVGASIGLGWLLEWTVF